jgi:hypothetical protein
MIPFKYKSRKIKAVYLRNLENQGIYYIRIRPKNQEFKHFKSRNSEYTSNPRFDIKDTDPELMTGFYNIGEFEFIMEVYSQGNPDVLVNQHEIDLTQLQPIFKIVSKHILMFV